VEEAALRAGPRSKGEIAMAENVVRVCAKADVAPETAKAFEVCDQRLAVYNIGGTFYITDDECTHASASLADGILEGDIIECSLHFGAFDVKTGAVKAPPSSIKLRTYKVIMDGDDIHVDLDRDASGELA
jgi:nitrite reductase/ring-hydroxylating ferredoxin subunit